MQIISFRDSRAAAKDTMHDVSSISIEDGLIVDISFGENETRGSDFDSVTVLPGFVDVHIHGAVGIDVNEADTDELLQIAAFLAKNGVTTWLPTLVPDSDDNYSRSVKEIDRLMEIQVGKPVAQAVGVHYEGVFANENMCGALRPEYFKSGQWLVAGGRLPRLRKGVHMTTIAPEVEGGIELIGELMKQDWVVSIGHTRADVGILDRAFVAGARHMTHFFNAMTGIHHRDLGVSGWGLANPDVTFDIIADGIHVDPKMLEMACRVKSPDNVSLISDSVAPTGLGDGDYELWGETVTVKDGRTKNERGSIAGSVITMHDALKRMISLGLLHIATRLLRSRERQTIVRFCKEL
jgi:N-acetylglucosamine-6-phosphate deacetylase